MDLEVEVEIEKKEFEKQRLFNQFQNEKKGAQCGKMRNSLSPRKYFIIITSVTCLVKTLLLSRDFCQKSVRVNFRNFHTVR